MENGSMPAGSPRHQGLEILGDLCDLPLPGGPGRLGSMGGLARGPGGGTGWSVDLGISRGRVDSDGSLQRIVKEREVHDP
ncbi:hypothetical protein ACFRJ9_17250 [Paenarthrobacter sp. NPDC056912]|uniref:hypothetical protein n=1 Tax=Paenarthrobacter sp. NPDC056912 TaxID=3345965 RepID=UPI003671BC8A